MICNLDSSVRSTTVAFTEIICYSADKVALMYSVCKAERDIMLLISACFAVHKMKVVPQVGLK